MVSKICHTTGSNVIICTPLILLQFIDIPVIEVKIISYFCRSAQQRRSGYGSLRRALLSVFDMDELDLRVILAQAEILEPGFYSYVTSMSQ